MLPKVGPYQLKSILTGFFKLKLSFYILGLIFGYESISLAQSLGHSSDSNKLSQQNSKVPAADSSSAQQSDNPLNEILTENDIKSKKASLKSRLKNKLDQKSSGSKSYDPSFANRSHRLPSSPVKRSTLAALAKINGINQPADAWDQLPRESEASRRTISRVSTSGLIKDFADDKLKQISDMATSQQSPSGSGLTSDVLIRGAASLAEQFAGVSLGAVALPDGFVLSLPSNNGTIQAVFNEDVNRYVFDMKIAVPFVKAPPSNNGLPRRYRTAGGRWWSFSHFEYKVDLDCDGDSTGWLWMPASQNNGISVVGVDFSPVRAFKTANGWLRERQACINVRARGRDLNGTILPDVVQSSNTQRVILKAPESDPFVLIGMGDSYGSGEGNPYSNTATNVSGLQWWKPSAFGDLGAASRDQFLEATAPFCHRSSESGLGKAARALYDGNKSLGLSMGFAHVACSGATSRKFFEDYAPNFYENGQWTYTNTRNLGPSFNRGNDAVSCYGLKGAALGPTNIASEERRRADRDGYYRDCTVDPQLLQADWWASKHFSTSSQSGNERVDAVVVSISGNDAKFTQFIKDCVVLDFSCHDESSTLSNADLIPARIKSAIYWAAGGIQQRFPNAQIYFTSYIDPVSKRNVSGDRDVCSENDLRSASEFSSDPMWDLTRPDAEFLQRVIQDINAAMREQVEMLREWRASTGERRAQLEGQMLAFFPDNAPDLYRPRPSRPDVRLIENHFLNHRDNGFCLPARRVMMFSDEAGPLQGFDKSGIYSSGGFHPNDYGYSLYATSIVDALKNSSGFRRSWPSPVPATPTYLWVEN